DIHAYLKVRMSDVVRRHPTLGDNWPGKEKMRKLSERASGLFIWATVACDFIRDRQNPKLQLRKILSADSAERGKAERALDGLYLTILEPLKNADEEELNGLKYVIGSIITAKNPLTWKGLDSLLDLGSSLEESSFILPED